MRENLIKILKGETAKLAVGDRRKISTSFGIELKNIMVSNPERAEEQADKMIAALGAMSEANKQEVIAGIPCLAFLFEAPQASDAGSDAAKRTRGPNKPKDPPPAAATTAAAGPVAGAVSEGFSLRLEQVELRLGRVEEAIGIAHERQVQLLINVDAVMGLLLLMFQTQGITNAATTAELAKEAGVEYRPLVGG
jgi:hypothetical protein